MKILSLLSKNLRRGIATLRFPAAPPVAAGFRGLVCFDPARCTGCAVCRFRCTAKAITFTSAGKQFTWAYNPGQCTFCGRCVEGCKDHALSQDPNCPPVYLASGDLTRSYTVERKAPPARPRPAAATEDPGGKP